MSPKYKIYVVDDNEFNLLMVSTRLRRLFDCQVKSFLKAEECIRAIEDEVPDLVVTDYRLRSAKARGMNGDQMMQHIKNDYPDLPVIIYSYFPDLEMAVKMMRNGAADFVPRDRHFLNKIAETVQVQLIKVKNKYEVLWGKFSILALIVLFSGSLFFIYNTSEIWLKYFIFTIAIFVAIMVFFGEWFLSRNRKSET